MIDAARFRDDPEFFREAWRRRGTDVDVDALVALDAEVRRLKTASESKRAESNQAAKAIGQAAKEGRDIEVAKAEARQLSDAAKRLNEERALAEGRLRDALLGLPNPCLPEVPDGQDERANRIVDSWGDTSTFAFEARPHWELASALDIIDFERGSKLSGSGFVVYKGLGARLQRALINWFIEVLTTECGYTEVQTPLLVTPQTMQGTGQLPKFGEQLYRCADDELYLIPTAEVPITNLHADEILEADQLPLRYCGHTPCFRREAGAAGVGTRGITRVHQFDKVEMVWLTTPERSQADLLTLRGNAETLLQRLGLHYRVVDLCAGDTGFSAAHTYDLEVWSAGTGTWLEVSSCSTFTDFQARRAGLRFRPEPGAKAQPLHTLNGSGLALPRVVIGILESGQQEDGSVLLPEVLRPWMGCERITPVG
ncbi:MAG: serine--tRNA ligase [Planctomycetota bacterium]